ncbi:MAG: hypothetical protein V1855_04015 [bacterium]
MKHFQYQIPGSFGKKKIDIDLCVNKSSSSLIILFHGSFGYTRHIKKTKYEIISRKLSKNCSVGFYQTSRFFEWREKPNLTFEQYRDASFKNKTFRQELDDVKSAINEIVIQTKRYSKKRNLRITFIGFSLGGIMCLLVQERFKKVVNIFTFGTAIEFKKLETNSSIVKDVPTKNKLKEKIQKFNGNLTLVRGTKDDLADFRNMSEIYKSARNAQLRTLIELKGVDHQFKTINGVNRERKLITWIENLIKKGGEKNE